MRVVQHDPVKDAYRVIVAAIEELQAMGVEVPAALHRAALALGDVDRSKAVAPACRPPGQS